MTSSKKYYLGAIFLFAALFVGNLFLQHGFAWTNPTSNPPTASPTITTSGSNIGIGTASPTQKLDVAGNIQSSGDIYANGGSYWGDGKAIVTFSDGWLRLNPSNGFTSGIYAGTGILRTDGPLQVGSNGSMFLVNSAGDVGIGTTAPGAKLDIGVGATECCATQTPNLSLAQASSVNGNMSWLQFHNSGESEAYIRLAGGGAGVRAGQRRIEIGDSQGVNTGLTVQGNVGIGTTAPGAKLEVVGQVKITGGTPGAGKVLTSDASGLASWTTPSSGMGGSGTANYVPKFTTGSTLGDSSIFDNGNVGIGATNPQAKLSVGSNGLVNYGIYGKGSASGVYGEGSTGYGVFGYATTGTGVNGMSTSYRGVTGDSSTGVGGYFTSGSGYALITGNGNVGIGTANPLYKLDVSGDIRTSGALRTPSGSVKPPIVHYINVPIAASAGQYVLVSRDINVTADMVGQPIWVDLGVQASSVTSNPTIGLDGFTVLKNGVLFPLSSDNGPYYGRVADYYNGARYYWNLRNSYFFTPDGAGTYNITIKGYSSVTAGWYYLKMIIQAGTNDW